MLNARTRLRFQVLLNDPAAFADFIAAMDTPAGGGAMIYRVPFAWNTGTFTMAELVPGDVVVAMTLYITTPWNLPGASIKVGTPSAPMALFAPVDGDPYTIGSYGPALDYHASVAEDLRIIVAGPSTQGAGYALFTLGPNSL